MKSVVKVFGIIALVAVIGFSMAGCDILFGTNGDKDNGGTGSGNDGGGGGSGIKPTITIKNNTGYYIDWISIKPSTEAKDWGTAGRDLSDGQSLDYTLDKPLSVHNVYDISISKGLFFTEYSFAKFGVTVSNKMTITFTTADVTDYSFLPKITIQNRSGKRFDSIQIKPSISSDWSESFGNVYNNSDFDITIQIPPTNHTVFDIQAKSTNPTNTYTQTNVTISNGMTILFTSAHKELPTIEPPVIVIQNNTGYTVDIYMKQSGSDDWGNALTGNWSWDDVPLASEKSRTFSVSQTLGNLIDIKLTGSSFNFIKRNVTVSDGLILTFTVGDNQP